MKIFLFLKEFYIENSKYFVSTLNDENVFKQVFTATQIFLILKGSLIILF
jgi:hypothetical protein